MYLKKIEIQGFKSFAKKTVLEFDKGIVSIVGPNGSGKSNLADAIRWVLGEQSLKAIRSKKSEDVIFAGSDKKGRQGMAEVSITFNNADRKLPLDFAEVVFTRRLYRDGESEYLINKRPVRLMDITEVLAKSGYGGYSYHIISQGTIDQLVIAGPGAIKTLIEEASGVKPYYIKRERAVRKLEKTRQNLLRVADLIKEIEPRLRSLRRQTKRMEQREEISARLKDLEFKYFSGSYSEIKKELTEVENKIGQYDKQSAVLSDEITQVSANLKRLEHEAEQRGGGYAKLQEELRRLEQEKNKVQEDLAIIRGRLKSGLSVGGADKGSLVLRQQELENKIKNSEAALTDLKHQTVLLERNLKDHQRIYERLQKDIEHIRKGIESAKNPSDLTRLKNDIEKIYSRYQSLLYQINNLQSEDDFKQLQEDARNLEILLVKTKDRMIQLSDVHLNHSELLHLNAQLQKIFSKREGLQKEIAELEAAISANRQQQKFYAEQIAEWTRELAGVKKNLQQAEGSSPEQQWKEMSREETSLNEQLRQFEEQIRKKELSLKEVISKEAQQKKELLEEERRLRQKQDELAKIKDQRGLVLIEKARLEANLESLFNEVRKSLGNDYAEKIKASSPTPFDATLEQQIQKLKGQLELIGGVDELTMQEYKETEERYSYLTGQSKDLEKAAEDLRNVIAELDAVIKKQFQAGFEKINEKFSEYFRALFSGGRARMNLLKERRPTEDETAGGAEESEESAEDNQEEKKSWGKEEITGIEVRAVPPGKKLATLSALSGGERTLTAIALLVAILDAFPSPFVVLDEVDAALDEANSVRFGKILKTLAHQTQFITITHNRETMRNSGMLYGVTMGDDGISKVLSIKLEKAVEIAE